MSGSPALAWLAYLCSPDLALSGLGLSCLPYLRLVQQHASSNNNKQAGQALPGNF